MKVIVFICLCMDRFADWIERKASYIEDEVEKRRAIPAPKTAAPVSSGIPMPPQPPEPRPFRKG